MRRAAQLARRAHSRAEPNPRVGAVLVHYGRIIGEGWHTACGHPHAEVEAVRSVAEHNRNLLPASTLYVTLEPCSHHGRTPPCADLILRERIPHVVIACPDPNPIVSGAEKLREAGIRVEILPLPEADALLAHFRINQAEKRPFITLKWAQAANGVMGQTGQRILLTGPEAQRFTHRLRAEHSAIAIGQGTLLADFPRLDTRLFPGPAPHRVVFWGSAPEWPGGLWHEPGAPPPIIIAQQWPTGMPPGTIRLPRLPLLDTLRELYTAHGIGSVFVEGGSQLLTSFLSAGLADEIVCLKAPAFVAGNVLAPAIPADYEAIELFDLRQDSAIVYRKSA